MPVRIQQSPRIAHSRARTRRRLRLRPDLMVLEDRTLLASFAVTNLQDSGTGSLRDAIVLANASPGLDRIAFDDGLFNSGPQTITLTSGFLEIRDDLTLQGPGADWLTVSGNMSSQVFFVRGPAAATLSGLTISKGKATALSGGGILNAGGKLDLIGCTISGNSSTAEGGGISNGGTMTMTDCTVFGNTTADRGGGIFNSGFGTLTMTRCTVAGNTGTSSTASRGGGIFNSNALSMTNCTVYGNSALFNGGGIANTNGTGPSVGSLLINCTITGNTAPVGGGIYNNNFSPVTLHNSIVAYSQGGAISGTVSGSHNLIDDAANAGGLTHQVNGNLVGVLPQIAPPGNYGGPTQTVALLGTSPGVNAGTNSVIPPGVTDQRGAPRINGGTVDIGAYERGPTTLVVTTLVDEDNGGPSPSLGAGTSLREAITFANTDPTAGGTITFAPGLTGSIALAGGALPVLTATMTIVGPGASSLTIDGQGIASSGILSIAAGANVAISGLTVANGRANRGSGVSNRGNLTLTRTTIAGNTATDTYFGGGGIRNDSSGTLALNECTVSGNSASIGGGIANYGAMVLRNCTVSGNTAATGGGLNNYNGGRMALTGCTISGNTATFGGAGLSNYGVGTTLTNCTIVGNTVTSSFGSGGGITNVGSTLTLANCTIMGNTASDGAGILNSVSAAVTLWNTIVAANQLGGDVDGLFAGGNNLIGDGSGGIPGTITGAPKLGPLTWNGGPTQTMAPLPGSPAIDAGDGSRIPTGVVIDQRGVPRIKHGVLDIGAFESGSQTLVVTTLADTVGSGLSLRSAIDYVNNIDPVGDDTIIFAPGLTGTIVLAGAALPTIVGDVTIVGPGSRVLTIDGQGVAGSGILSVAPGAVVFVSGLTLTNGRAESGGAIFNAGTLTLADLTISNSTASLTGGGIYNKTGATLTLTRSTISGNTSGVGGGIISYGVMALTNCTVSGNSATFGGGLFNADGTATIASSTIAGNSASLSGGGIASTGSLTLTNSIVALSTLGGDLVGTITGSHNLIGDGIHGLPDTITGDPKLGSLAWNGGPTQTMALLAGSPAIDAGDGTRVPVGVATDQRGGARTKGGNVDIGAFESGVNTLVITTLIDEDNGGIDTTLGTGTSLREAIAFANSDPSGGNTITFEPGLTGTIALVGGALPTIVANLTITGPGARLLTIDEQWAGSSRIFTIASGTYVVLSGLTLTRGSAATGGAVLNNGTLELTESTITNSSASSSGGAIYNAAGATLRLTRSTISGNGGGNGGGIANFGTLSLISSTLAGNKANRGGALYNDSAAGLVTIANSTIADNLAYVTGGGILNSNGFLALTNSIVALSTLGGDLVGTITGSHNLIGDGVHGLPDTITGDPKLGSLAWNGGPTQTMALLTGSPAIGVGVNLGYTTDQRNIALDSLPDIGAFEYQGAAPTVTISAPATGIVHVFGNYTLTATDNTPGDQDVTFTYTVDWNGDGTDVQSFTGPASLQVTHAYDVAGSYAPIVTVTDQHNRSGGPATSANPVVVSALTSTNLAQAISTLQNVSLSVTSHVQGQAVMDAVNGVPLATWQQSNTVNFVVSAGVISDQVIRPTSADARINVSVPTPPMFLSSRVAWATNVSNPYGGESQQLAATIAIIVAAVAVGSVIGANVGAGYIPSGVPLPSWSPGLVVEQGTVTWSDTLFITATDSPLIVVKGGTLILKHSMIVGSPLGTRPVIEVSGGTLILAAPAPGESNVLGTFGLQPLIRVTGTGKVIDEGGTTYLQFNSDGTLAHLAGTTVTQLTSSAPSAVIGQTVTYTATVTGAPAGEGSVQFIDATTSTLLGTVPLGSDRSAALSFTVSTATAGHTIVATYLPTNGAFHPSSGQLTQAVVAATTTVVTSPASTSAFGQSVTFTATVTNTSTSDGVPTGTVQFFVGSTPLGVGTLLSGNGNAATFTFTTANLPVGTQSIRAVYTPVGGFQAGDGAKQVAVNPAGTTTILSSSAGSTIPGQSVTFTAIVAAVPPGGGTPTGSVTFKNGSTVVGTVPLVVVGNQVLASLTTVFSTASNLTITASYASSNGNHTASSATLNQAILGAGVSVSGTTLYIVGANTSDEVTISAPSPQGSQGLIVNAKLNGVSTKTTFTQALTAIVYYGYEGNDKLTLASNLALATTILVGNGNVTFQLGNGNNTVTAGNGNVTIQAGDGKNTIAVGNGNNTVRLGNGENTVTTGNGNDTIQAGDGKNTIAAGAGNNTVRLGDGNNTVTAGAGNDTIQAGDGNNTIVAGNGNNTVRLGDGNNTVTADAGNDTIQAGNGDNTIAAGNGNNTIQAGDGDNAITASNGNNTVCLGDGNNSVIAGAGSDTIQAGDGNNTIAAGAGNNTVRLGDGNNTVTADAGNDTIQAGDGNNTIAAGNGNNSFCLGDGTNTVTAGAGNDTIQAGDGNNTIAAGAGNNTIRLGDGNNTVTADAGNDTIQTGDGDNTITSGNGNDTIQAGDGDNTVTAGHGNNTIRLGNGENVVVAGNGNNTIRAGNGNNLVVGGLGSHTIQLGNGNNILIDGSAVLTSPGDSLRQVLRDWNSSAATAVKQRISVTYNSSHPSSLQTGKGRNWFFYQYAKTTSNKKSTDFLN
ncbi:choice-of-anchor Q domain-containing protein [Singulisphaera sp. Ch08]|uniref:Choice-of-anchor Q domain-containing protein n=1 Tax=Singulisphaera sp. Ch08 TaxID=3120278 RepID=A0AAU7CA66_9BACT